MLNINYTHMKLKYILLVTRDYIFMDLNDDFKKPGERFYCKIITLVKDKMSVSSHITY